MRMRNPSLFCAFLFVVLGLNQSPLVVCNSDQCKPISASDDDYIDFLLNFEYLICEMFLKGAIDKGLDELDPNLANGGPPPIGAERANLDPENRRIIEEFGYQNMEIIRDLQKEGEIARSSINLSKQLIAEFIDAAFGRKLMPPFDPYANSLNFFLVMCHFTHNVMVGYVGATPNLNHRKNRELFSGILGMKAGQNTVARAYLYRRRNNMVVPYNITVAEFETRVSDLLNDLGKCGIKEEGIEVPRFLGAAGRTESNILSADDKSLSYSRTARELLRIAYGTGDEKIRGGFFPEGVNGKIGKGFMKD